jgi:hypothetical protein
MPPEMPVCRQNIFDILLPPQIKSGGQRSVGAESDNKDDFSDQRCTFGREPELFFH